MVLASDAPLALGGLTTGHLPTTETHTLSVNDGEWSARGALYNEADAPEPTLEGGACMANVNGTVYEIGTETVAAYITSLQVINYVAIGYCVLFFFYASTTLQDFHLLYACNL